MKIFLRTALLVLVIVAMRLPTQASVPDSIEADIFSRVNAFRGSQGVSTLTLDPCLGKVAHAHSQEMLDLNYFSHVSPTAGMERSSDRVRNEGLQNVTVGENIAEFQGYPVDTLGEEAMTTWMESPTHRANMLDPAYTRVGIGVASRDDKYLFTQVFSKPR